MSVNALLKPRSIEVETAEGNPYSATVTMEPFETGYAHTLGTLSYTHLTLPTTPYV